MVGALTGDRTGLWGKQHGGRPVSEAVLQPVDLLDARPAPAQQLGDFVIEQGPFGDRIVEAWKLLDAVSR